MNGTQLLIGAFIVAAASATGQAQGHPDKPIRFIAPFAPAGSSDRQDRGRRGIRQSMT